MHPEATISVKRRQLIGSLLQTPWKLVNNLERLLWLPIVRLSFAWCGIEWGRNWRIYGLPIIQRHRKSRIVIGEGAVLRSTVRSNPLGPYHPIILSTRRAGATITIGANFGMTSGAIVAEEHIAIGNNVLIGANCILMDTDFHPIDLLHRQQNPSDATTSPITIEDDVFIGMQSVVLKGVTIGAGSVIGAGSIVTRNIPPRVIAAGNPAHIVRSIYQKGS